MSRSICRLFLLSLLALGSVAIDDAGAQSPWESTFTHGVIEGGLVTTRDETTITYSDSRGEWVPVTGSAFTVTLEPQDSDLFVYELDAICKVSGTDEGSQVVEVRLAVNGVFSRVFPRGQDNSFCKGASPQAHTRSWATRLSGGPTGRTLVFQLYWRLHFSQVWAASLNNQIVRLTRYD